jgi:DNA gyrase subunit B/topoisomerase-4 subunit B
MAEQKAKPAHELPFVLKREGDGRDSTRLEIVMQWTESTDELVRSYVNGIPTASGGSHENGFRSGVGKALRNYIDAHKLTPKGVTISSVRGDSSLSRLEIVMESAEGMRRGDIVRDLEYEGGVQS